MFSSMCASRKYSDLFVDPRGRQTDGRVGWQKKPEQVSSYSGEPNIFKTTLQSDFCESNLIEKWPRWLTSYVNQASASAKLQSSHRVRRQLKQKVLHSCHFLIVTHLATLIFEQFRGRLTPSFENSKFHIPVVFIARLREKRSEAWKKEVKSRGASWKGKKTLKNREKILR